MYLVGNWKMQGTWNDVSRFIEEITPCIPDVCAMIAFPAVYIMQAAPMLKKKGYKVAAQHCSIYENGAYTGQISASMLKDVGCDYVIVAHPETRNMFSFSQIDEVLSRVTKENMKAIVCIKDKKEVDFLPRTIHHKILLAYEPYVGTDVIPEHITHDAFILKAHGLPLLYGGGVDTNNLASLCHNYDGFLVGRACTHASRWNSMMHIISHFQQ